MNKLPNPKTMPGMMDVLKDLDPTLTILGNEAHPDFEFKLFALDVKIFNNIELGNLEAVARLTEMREAIIEERYILTKDYLTKKQKVIDEIEPEEVSMIKKGNEPGAKRLQFEKYRRIFRAQEQFLARNYPYRVHVKERMEKWRKAPSIN